jgi:hypothetical protein
MNGITPSPYLSFRHVIPEKKPTASKLRNWRVSMKYRGSERSSFAWLTDVVQQPKLLDVAYCLFAHQVFRGLS